MSSFELMEKISAIRNARGLNRKMELLSRAPELKKVLRACYDPYLQYYIVPKQSWITIVGTGDIGMEEGQLLYNLHTRKLTGTAAKNAVVRTLERLEPYAQGLLLCILNKDMSWGLGPKSINKVFPGLIPEFEVQLAKLYDPTKIIFPAIATYKIDGLRCIYEQGQLYSRRGHKLVGLDHIADQFRTISGLKRVDGEITVPGMVFDDISGAIRSFRKNDNAVFNVFDVQLAQPAPLYNRLTHAAQICMSLRCRNVALVPYLTVTSEEHLMQVYQTARDLGYEGLVVKKEDGMYTSGRSYDWMKIKPHDTVDVTVEDIEYGQGKYEFQVGSLVCNYNGITIRVGGGLSDLQRQRWSEDPTLIVGKTIEVDYMELSKNGALRHPRLKAVRGDK